MGQRFAFGKQFARLRSNYYADSNGNGSGDGSGTHVNSSDCRIEGNDMTDNDRGIDVNVAGNLIVRDSGRGNASNYEIVASNSVGAILVSPGSGVTSGNGAFASSLGRTDP